MTETADTILGAHGARLDNLEREQTATASKLDRLLFLMLTTCLSSIGGLLAAMAALLHK